MSPRSPHCPGPATPSLLAGPRGGGRTWLCCPLQLVLALRPLHWASTPVGVQLGTVSDKDTRVGVLRGGVKSTLEVASCVHTVHSGRALGSFDALDLSAGGVFTYHQITALRSLQDAGFASHRVWIFVVGINSAAPSSNAFPLTSAPGSAANPFGGLLPRWREGTQRDPTLEEPAEHLAGCSIGSEKPRKGLQFLK